MRCWQQILITDETDIADGLLLHLFIRFIRYQNLLPTQISMAQLNNSIAAEPNFCQMR
jgi:hypothetical protein